MKALVTLTATIATLVFSGPLLAQTCKRNVMANTSAEQFVDVNDGYVIDVKTGLMWSKCLFGQHYENGQCTGIPEEVNTWSAALKSSEQVGIAGFNDWRLPNVKELASIVEYQCYAPAIRLDAFPDTPSAGFWTNTPNAEFEQLGALARKGRVIDFTYGLDALPQTNPHIYVRFVRDSGI